MNYFSALTLESEALTARANSYLEKLPFLDNDTVLERLHKAAWKIFQDSNQDHEAVPWWVNDIVDGWIPFLYPSKNGSLFYSFGLSPAACDARLRNLLEIAEGREAEELDLPTIPPKDFFNKYETPPTKKAPRKKRSK